MLGATIDDDDGFDASFASSTAAPTDSSVVAADTADVPTEHAPPLLPGPADNDDFFDGMFDGLIAPPSQPAAPTSPSSPGLSIDLTSLMDDTVPPTGIEAVSAALVTPPQPEWVNADAVPEAAGGEIVAAADNEPDAVSIQAASDGEPSAFPPADSISRTRPVLSELVVPVSPIEEGVGIEGGVDLLPRPFGISEPDPNLLTSPLGTELLHRKVGNQVESLA